MKAARSRRTSQRRQNPSPDRERPLRQGTYTATQAKNVFGRLLDQAIHGDPVIITRHDAPRAVLISMDQFTALKQAPETKLNTLSREFDQLLERMQTTKARAAVDRLFRATPEELGKAAVTGARRRG